jgi:hypothetical protein
LPIKKFFLTSEQTDKDKSLVNRVSCALFVLLIVASAFARSSAPEVIFVSPCECQGFHGKTRWVTKTDSAHIPSDKFAIQLVTPSQIYAWEGPGPDVDLTRYTEERMPSEQKWYALTGRIVGLKVEADGDIHLALQDATGDKPGIVVCEVPAKPQRCSIRETVFSWTNTRFPFHTSSAKKLTLDQTPVITVTGKAFSDVGHSLKDQQSNRRSHLPGYAAWEIHPVRKMEVR